MGSGLEVHLVDIGFALSIVLRVRILSRAFGRRVGTCGEGGAGLEVGGHSATGMEKGIKRLLATV
jgi:hypothetical protein